MATTPDYSFTENAPAEKTSAFGAASNGMPVAKDSGFGANVGDGPEGIPAPVGFNNAAPGAVATPWSGGVAAAPEVVAWAFQSTDAAAVARNPDGSFAPVPTMPGSFPVAFVELTGNGPTLKSLTANAAIDAGTRCLQGFVNGELKSYRVAAGVDAEALPGIVRPSNFDPVNNACVFVAC
jgi:hypothetical protein